jgi:protoheme IX farnesyltransferase
MTIRDHIELTKPRIVVMILLTTVTGFYLGALGSLDLTLLLHTLIGTGLVVASANGLNQLLERDADARMRRTQNRPLPTGRMEPQEALYSGIGMAIAGCLYLLLFVNPLTSLLATVAWVNYLFLYTPLKKRTSVSTLVGAVSGALPPVIGWTAVRGTLSPESMALFLILFLWQLPHFLAIAWMYREDYARAGFPMLPVVDSEGSRTGRQIVLYGVALVPISLMPTLFGLTGSLYFFGALVLGLSFLAFGIRTAFYKTALHARHLLLASLLFLPFLLGLMMFDKGAL